MADDTPKQGTALAYAAAVLEAGGINYTLNLSTATTVVFLGPKGAAAAAAAVGGRRGSTRATKPMRRLTGRQAAVLEVVQRLGSPTLPDVAAEFPDIYPSGVAKVLRALGRMGRVTWTGDWAGVYLGDRSYPGRPGLDPSEVVRFTVNPS